MTHARRSQAPHLDALGAANRAFARRYPGDRAARQPVHTVYGGAQLFKAETTRGSASWRCATPATPTRRDAGRASPRGVGLRRADAPTAGRAELAARLRARARASSQREPVEDFRIDFEDGFGARPDAEEDATAVAAAREVARGMARGHCCRRSSASASSRSARSGRRAARARSRSSSTRCSARPAAACPTTSSSRCRRSPSPSSRATLVRLFELLEARHGLPAGTLRIELMIEDDAGAARRRRPLAAARLPRRLRGALRRRALRHLRLHRVVQHHRGATRAMDHPLCDLAKGMMMLAYAGTGIFLSDGATNVMPVGAAPRATR